MNAAQAACIPDLRLFQPHSVTNLTGRKYRFLPVADTPELKYDLIFHFVTDQSRNILQSLKLYRKK